jgi:adenylate cyclase
VDNARIKSLGVARRVERSFGFIDLCGFCDFADAQGDDEAAAELRLLRSSVREITPLFRTRVDKWLGDGVMLVGVENKTLVASVVAIAEAHRSRGRLSLRAGLACGDALLLEGDDYVGRPVNLAARLCDLAEPGQVLSCRDHLRLPSWVLVDQKTKLEVRGFSEPVSVVTLTARDEGSSLEPKRLASAVVDGITQPIRALIGAGLDRDTPTGGEYD